MNYSLPPYPSNGRIEVSGRPVTDGPVTGDPVSGDAVSDGSASVRKGASSNSSAVATNGAGASETQAQQNGSRANGSKAAAAAGTLRERIADGLRESIVRGDLQPGARLQEIEVSEQYHTSRTPVREAFRQLESEGFLQIRARRGAVVTSITTRDISEFYEIKGVLEGHAARMATERLSSEQIDKMESYNEELEQCYREGDLGGMIKAHNQFHDAFVKLWQ